MTEARHWMPEPMWPGEDAFIIGGGPSLKGFDWSLLEDENTIGCNNAFRLGPKVCDVCFFADRQFIIDPATKKPRAGYYDELSKFPNLIVTNDTQLNNRPETWFKWMPRKPKGLHYDALGFNANAGAGAINLALLFGAIRIYLLGFDMHLDTGGRPNWHEYIINTPDKMVYERMLHSFGHVKNDLPVKFPGCQIFNVNRDSALTIFPMLDPDIFWKNRKEQSHGKTDQRCSESSARTQDVYCRDSGCHTRSLAGV